MNPYRFEKYRAIVGKLEHGERLDCQLLFDIVDDPKNSIGDKAQTFKGSIYNTCKVEILNKIWKGE